jgi:hypothetical protein
MNVNYASIGNMILAIVAIIAGYLVTIGQAPAALIATTIGLVIKAIFSEIDNQTVTTTPTAVPAAS